MCMCQGRRCHSVWLYFLLIAVAIQGVTPDARDLASMNSLLLFCPALADSRDLAGEDGLPDEVCGPAESEIGVGLRGRVGAERSGQPSFGNDRSTMIHCQSIFVPVDLTPAAASIRDSDDLIYALCRLKC